MSGSVRRSLIAVSGRFLLATAAGNFVWEAMQAAIYSVWYEPSGKDLMAGVLTAWGWDVLLALACLLFGKWVGGRNWPLRMYPRGAIAIISSGLVYTAASEWLYARLYQSMLYGPVPPGFRPFLSVSSLLQWLLIPTAALLWARRAVGTARFLF